MSEEPIIIEVEGPVATITLNRPEKKNALNRVMRERLRQFLANETKNIKVAIVTANGDTFCAGMDLSEPIGHGESRDQWSLFKQLFNTQVVCIAAINGPCIGAGQTIVSACDLAIADPSTTFSLPQIAHGFYGGVAAAMLHVSLPKKIVAEMSLTGEPLSAERAREVGLINRISEPGAFLQDARALAQKIAGYDETVLHIAKDVITNLPDSDADREAAVREVKIATLANIQKKADAVPDTRHKKGG